MSDTPRTDAAEEPRGDGWYPDVVPVEFARQLERELNECRAFMEAAFRVYPNLDLDIQNHK